jgi:SPP1 family phage portal protein
MNADELKKKIDTHSQKLPRILNQQAQALGNNPGIFRPGPKSAPDNRIPVPIARQVVQFVTGYMGKPGNTTYSGDYYENTLKPIYDFNDEQLLTSNELEDACIHGVCYELHWLDESGNKNFYSVPVSQGIPIWSNDLKRVLLGFIWHRTVDEAEYATVYSQTTVEEWEKGAKDWTITKEETPHGYTQTPVNIGMIDRDGRNLFDHVIPIMDAIDKLTSADVMNEADRYAGALLAMAERIDTVTQDELGRTMVDRMKELALIDDLKEGNVKDKIAFITKDLPVDFIKFAIEFLERMARESLQLPNMMDPKFGESSGIAKAFQLLPLEYLCARIEAHFTRFLYNRIYLISGISKALKEDTAGVYEVQIKMDRNLPEDLLEKVEMFTKLKGAVSDETALKILPTSLVPNIGEELERMGALAQEVLA